MSIAKFSTNFYPIERSPLKIYAGSLFQIRMYVEYIVERHLKFKSWSQHLVNTEGIVVAPVCLSNSQE